MNIKIKGGFTQIRNSTINNTKIPDGAFRTYIVLKSFKYGLNNVFPSEKTLAELRGKSKKTIIEHLKKLRLLKLISYKKRGFSASNQYEFISEGNFTNESNIGNENCISKVKNISPLLLQEFQSNNTKLNNNELNNTEEENKRLLRQKRTVVLKELVRKLVSEKSWT
jgi:DNA-binding transcriptional MocR family regulator